MLSGSVCWRIEDNEISVDCFQDNKLVKMALDRTASEKSNHILVFLLHEAAGYVKLE